MTNYASNLLYKVVLVLDGCDLSGKKTVTTELSKLVVHSHTFETRTGASSWHLSAGRIS